MMLRNHLEWHWPKDESGRGWDYFRQIARGQIASRKDIQKPFQGKYKDLLVSSEGWTRKKKLSG